MSMSSYSECALPFCKISVNFCCHCCIGVLTFCNVYTNVLLSWVCPTLLQWIRQCPECGLPCCNVYVNVLMSWVCPTLLQCIHQCPDVLSVSYPVAMYTSMSCCHFCRNLSAAAHIEQHKTNHCSNPNSRVNESGVTYLPTYLLTYLPSFAHEI